MDCQTQRLTTIVIAQKGAHRTLAYFLPAFGMRSGDNDKLLARGLYRLGFEDEDVLAKLNHPLSSHEKMELRLSLPREFWPKMWLAEEAL